MNSIQEKPELVKADSGFSVLYKDKYLYSKRNPKKLILNLIDKTEIPPQSLVLCISPLMGYGIEDLLKKTPGNSILVAVEQDPILMDFSFKQITQIPLIKKTELIYSTLTFK